MLVRTAERHAGRCIPCAKGYRDSLERSRLYYEEVKRLESDPGLLFWRSLCERVDNPALGFSSLPVPEKLYFAVCLLEGEVFNGGFEQYFTNSFADYFDYALRGLRKIGDDVAYDLAYDAKRLLFGVSEVPGREARLDHFESTGILEIREVSRQLDVLDEEFVKNYEDQLSDKLRKFALDNGFWDED